MDGNGRWAKARGQERLYGHMQGVESIRKTVKAAIAAGVRFLTLYAFSKENWGRPQEEIDGLMEIFCKCAVNETPELKEQGVRMKFIGDIDGLHPDVRTSVEYCEKETHDNDTLTLVIAMNYSSRWEIIRMVKTIAGETENGKIASGDIKESTISAHLCTSGIPDPDLIIRTSGEHRLSNFLLWQAAYSEFYFTPVQWPDFDEAEFSRALKEYTRRDRRYGAVAEPERP